MRTADNYQIDQVVDRYYQPLFRFAVRLCGSPVKAMELTQRTFRQALDRKQSLPVPSNLRAWLFAILFHDYLDRRAQTRRA
jgi:RNA polymerase sigma-70 factor, ECF subfamily